MQKVDRPTVMALELTAPGACSADARALYGQLRRGQIFGNFNEQDREVIWSEVLSVSTDRLIPSFFSFFEDLNYLQGPANCVKRLIPLSGEDSLSRALQQMFSDVNQRTDQCVIQESESRFVFRPGSLADRVDFGRRQIWIGAMRDYLEIPAQRKKARNDLLAKPTNNLSETALCKFAALAY